MLFEDHEKESAAKAMRGGSPAAKAKAASRKTADGQPVHSFRTLLQDLATLTRNTVRFGDAPPVTMLAKPTLIQQEAFEKLAVPLAA